MFKKSSTRTMVLQMCTAVLMMCGLANPTHGRNVPHLLSCKDPDNPELELASALYDLYMDPLYRNFTLNIAPCYMYQSRLSVVSLDAHARSIIQRKCTRHNDMKHQGCVDGQSVYPLDESVQITASSLCSWKHIMDVDEDRYPRIIATAACTCQHCHRGTCQSIYSYIPAVKKECDGVTGIYNYQKYIYKVPTACACVKGETVEEWDNGAGRTIMAE